MSLILPCVNGASADVPAVSQLLLCLHTQSGGCMDGRHLSFSGVARPALRCAWSGFLVSVIMIEQLVAYYKLK